MTKLLAIIAVAAAALCVGGYLMFGSPGVPQAENSVDQYLYDHAASADPETERSYIESRLLGLEKLETALAGDDLPPGWAEEAPDLRRLLTDTTARLTDVLAQLETGNTRAATKTLRALEIETVQAQIASKTALSTVEQAMRDALEPYYDGTYSYTDAEWETIKDDLRPTLAPRDLRPARRAYVMQPVDNLSAKLLKDQLEILGEKDELLFALALDYEIYYRTVQGYGAGDTALAYGVALHQIAGQSDKAIEVMGPNLEAIIANPDSDLTRFTTEFAVYLEALSADDAKDLRNDLATRLVATSHARIAKLEAEIIPGGTMDAATPAIRAVMRIEAAKRLHKMGLVAEAIPFLEEVETLFPADSTVGIQTMQEAKDLLASYAGELR